MVSNLHLQDMDGHLEGVPQQYLGDLLTMATWMSQKGSKTSVNGVILPICSIYEKAKTHLRTIDPNFLAGTSKN